MTLVIDNIRRREKRTDIAGVRPTIPPSEDHTDGSWVDTDIHEGEIFINTADGIVFTRIDSEIFEIQRDNSIVSGLELSNGSDSLNFDVSAGFAYVVGRLVEYLAVSDAVTIADGDVTNPRIDAVTIDKDANISVVSGTPSATPEIPSISSDVTLVDVILIEANYVAGSTPMNTFTIQGWNERYYRIKDWVTRSPYLEGVIVVRSTALYKCLETHVADVFTTDLSSGKWLLLSTSPSYVESFTSQSSVVVTHGLGTVPEVFIYDSTGAEIEGEIIYNVSDINNELTVNFNGNQTGTIKCII